MKVTKEQIKNVVREVVRARLNEKALKEQPGGFGVSEQAAMKQIKAPEAVISEAYYALQDVIDGLYDENYDAETAIEEVRDLLGRCVR